MTSSLYPRINKKQKTTAKQAGYGTSGSSHLLLCLSEGGHWGGDWGRNCAYRKILEKYSAGMRQAELGPASQQVTRRVPAPAAPAACWGFLVTPNSAANHKVNGFPAWPSVFWTHYVQRQGFGIYFGESKSQVQRSTSEQQSLWHHSVTRSPHTSHRLAHCFSNTRQK